MPLSRFRRLLSRRHWPEATVTTVAHPTSKKSAKGAWKWWLTGSHQPVHCALSRSLPQSTFLSICLITYYQISLLWDGIRNAKEGDFRRKPKHPNCSDVVEVTATTRSLFGSDAFYLTTRSGPVAELKQKVEPYPRPTAPHPCDTVCSRHAPRSSTPESAN